MNKALTIGHLARIAHVNVETIRYYQRVGLIVEPVKPLQGYRVYDDAILNRIRFIKRAQRLGFSLQEIAELLDLGEGRCGDVRAHAEKKRAQIQVQIRDLTRLKQTLDQMIDRCMNEGDSALCPMVETLIGDRT